MRPQFIICVLVALSRVSFLAEAALHAQWKLAGNLNDELGNFPGTSIGAVASFTGLDQVSGCNSPDPSQSAITMPTRSSTSYVTMDGGAFTGLTDFTFSIWWKPTHLTGLGGDSPCLWIARVCLLLPIGGT